MNTLNTRVLKEPLGFIRLIELPMAILAFATTAGYSQQTTIDVKNCGDVKPQSHSFSWGYSFALDAITIPVNLCNGSASGRPPHPFAYGTVSQAQFFVFVGVICFFYILATLVIYLLAWSKYENDKRYPLADFAITAILAVFWFISSCAWASGVGTVKSETDSNAILARLTSSEGPFPCFNSSASTPAPGSTIAPVINCEIPHTWNYASLNVSLILGFACFALWAANLWFIWKETGWYKARAAITTPSTGQGGPGMGSGMGPSGSSTGGGTFR